MSVDVVNNEATESLSIENYTISRLKGLYGTGHTSATVVAQILLARRVMCQNKS
ncbi:uncharacterized protein PHALS_01251 [Plasmopara halstedii]|uniref:Uncharacterized protein n=1 Tax=Plasmopara halstedii TaxID=4781 RepID=A0A0P1ASI7_PLAHL|nr:uncharacterized protein PHALS_01251 [Plasmopara halstedii]CEG44927.1 hypothetical protein PHALS_01251 [Plasmopara halstedii]|eukprot:XP_024581296.1 hypothetical protein PHALS_01251 [Plasmopara halstedii]